MAGGNGRRKKLVILAGVIVVVLVAAAVGVVLVKSSWLGSGNGTAARIADQMPADTMLIIWTGKVGRIRDLALAAGLDGEALAELSRDYRKLVKKLGYDPSTEEAMKGIGVDFDGPVGLAFFPSAKAGAMAAIYLPFLPEKSGVDALHRILEALSPPDLEFAHAVQGGHKVLWLRHIGDRGTGHADSAILDLDGGTLIVVPVEYRRDYAELIETELNTLVGRLVDPNAPRLSSVEGFASTVEGTGDVLIGGVFLPDAARHLMLAGDDEMALMLSSLADIAGGGMFLQEEGNTVRLVTRVSMKEGAKTFERERDLPVLDLIPGQPFCGLHLAFDVEKLMPEIEKMLATDRKIWRDYQEGIAEIVSEFNLPGGTRPEDLWNGEMGLFMSELSQNADALARGTTGFIGLADEELTSRLLDSLIMKTDGMMQKEWLGDTQVYRVEADEVTFGLMIHEGRLWMSGSPGTLEGVAKGLKGSLFEGERTVQLASVLRDSEANAALYVDLEYIITRLPAMLSQWERKGMERAWPLLSRLDYLTLTNGRTGKMGFSTLAVRVKGDSFVDAMVTELGSATADFTGYMRKAKTAEAIDMLDKIYKGAADYYSTPRVRENDGSKLDCQFPADQEITPPSGTCCAELGGVDANEDDRCDFDPDYWVSPTWSALKFMITDEHYCVYSFDQNDKTGAEAQFTANAHCDLDCDGILSTFQRYGKGDPRAGDWDCSVVSSAALFTANETE